MATIRLRSTKSQIAGSGEAPTRGGRTIHPSVLGHTLVREVLGRAVVDDRPAQAYVFSGPEGVGKWTCALWFARLLFCTQRSAQGMQPCGTCLPCRKVLSDSHPDVVVVQRQEERATIRVEQAREVQRAARFAPMDAQWKIFIFVDAQRLTDQAMNALLKLLEEPQERHIFVLLAPSHTALMPTVVSRCQLLRFGALSESEVTPWLREQGIGNELAELASVLSAGRPGMALRMASDKKLWDHRQKVVTLAAATGRADRGQVMDIAESLDAIGSDKRQAAERTLEVLTTWFRDVVWMQRGLDERRVLNRDHLSTLREAAGLYTPDRALHALGALGEAREHLAHNVNFKLMYMRLLLHLRAGS